MKKTALLVVQAVVVVAIISDFFFKDNALNYFASNVTQWAVIIAGFTLLLGAATLGSYHVRHIVNRTPRQWMFSIYTLLLIIVTFSLGVASTIPGARGAEWMYNYIVNNMLGPLSTATFGITAFYVFSVTFKAFVGRTKEVAVFLVAGLIVLLMNAPITEALGSGIGLLGGWILNVPSLAGLRGLTIGVGIGILATALRAVLGMEKGGIGG
jgi:hypothetical protein